MMLPFSCDDDNNSELQGDLTGIKASRLSCKHCTVSQNCLSCFQVPDTIIEEKIIAAKSNSASNDDDVEEDLEIETNSDEEESEEESESEEQDEDKSDEDSDE